MTMNSLYNYTPHTVLENTNKWLKVFGISERPAQFAEWNGERVFPYNWDEQTMKPVFDFMLHSRDEYLQFLADYHRVLTRLESSIKALKAERGKRYYSWDNGMTQSYAAQLGSAATRIYWLRHQARIWRRNCLNEQHEERMLDMLKEL